MWRTAAACLSHGLKRLQAQCPAAAFSVVLEEQAVLFLPECAALSVLGAQASLRLRATSTARALPTHPTSSSASAAGGRPHAHRRRRGE
eukprot:CAMPEP_0119096766 /NCGR_PEP_ID=MMETSP1178-20130426/173861_1 /TAXON_ID=33656 /ORGANISM="unid sp, Strain CCMP2000" /LENGTH=88 /DNA_ID=CAMNT_0007080667 /DNA_START=63 /DNA_END=329 /DNA_ORIENTATION=-